MRKRITVFCVAGDDPGLLAIQAVDALRRATLVVVDAQVEAVARAHAHSEAALVVVPEGSGFARRIRATRDSLAKQHEVVRVIFAESGCDGIPGSEVEALEPFGQLEVIPTVAAAALQAAHAWRERLPLHGLHVLVPRTKDPLSGMIAALQRDGARTTQVSTLSVEPPRTPQPMQRAIAGIAEGRFGWIVLTSANAFIAVWQQCREYGLDARAFAGMRIAAVGTDTLEALAAHGLAPDLVPSVGETTSALLEDFPEADPVPELVQRVLIPRADIAIEALATGLGALGWEVEEVTAFRTVRSAPPHAETRHAIKQGGFDAVVFTSSATVRNLIGLAGKPHARTLVACIGPSTAKTAEEHGLRVDVIAAEPTHGALVESLVGAVVGQREATAAVSAQDRTRRRGAK